MELIKDVSIKQRGSESLTTNTIHFIILIEMKEKPDMIILESVNKKATDLKVFHFLVFKGFSAYYL